MYYAGHPKFESEYEVEIMEVGAGAKKGKRFKAFFFIHKRCLDPMFGWEKRKSNGLTAQVP